MMTIRCRSKFSALLFCLPLGLCFASTSLAASDDDDEEWRDTKGPRSERRSSDEKDSEDSDKKAEKKSADDESGAGDKARDKKDSDDGDSEDGKKGKKEFKASTDSLPRESNLSAALLLGYGLPDPQGPGLGVRAGTNVRGALSLYFGGVFEYFFGMTVEEKNLGRISSQKWQLTYFGGEAGINVEASADFTIRPYVGLGIGLNKERHCSGDDECSGGTKVRMVIDPGIVGMYRLGSFFLGPDIRYLILPGGGTASGVAFSATAGMNF